MRGTSDRGRPDAPIVRRSNLIVPLTVERYVKNAWTYNPDAVILDLGDGVPTSQKTDARSRVRGALPMASKGATEVFVRVNKAALEADLRASVYPGLTGITLSRVESALEVREAEALIERLERRRGIMVGAIELVVLIESALGVWNAKEIARASERVTQMALDEAALCAAMGIMPTEEHNPLEYAQGRTVVEGTAAGVQPLIAAHPLGAIPRVWPRDGLLELALKSINLGSKGIICPHPSWVEPVNEAFTPMESQVEYYTQVREVFAEAVASGTAAVPFQGRMIDVPVDEWAKDVLALAAACRSRDDEKRLAREAVEKTLP